MQIVSADTRYTITNSFLSMTIQVWMKIELLEQIAKLSRGSSKTQKASYKMEW